MSDLAGRETLEEYGSDEDEKGLTYLRVVSEASEKEEKEELDGVVSVELKPSPAFQKWSGAYPGEEIGDSLTGTRHESALQKYQRLKREMKDFGVELAAISRLAESQSEEPTKDIVSKVNEEMGKLWLSVEEFAKNPMLTGLFGSEKESTRVDASMLLKRMSETSTLGTGSGIDSGNNITITLFGRSDRKSGRMSELEERIGALERVLVGKGKERDVEYARPGSYDGDGVLTGTTDSKKGLMTNVDLLWRRLDLLTDEGRLAQLQRRAETLKKGLEEITFATKEPVEDQITKAKESKIEEMFDMLQRWDAMNADEILPKVVSRLRSLQSLHNESAQIVRKSEQLVTQQSLIKGTLADSQSLLEEVSRSLAENAKMMSDNLGSIEKRILVLQSKF